jgi:hypothetical protein
MPERDPSKRGLCGIMLDRGGRDVTEPDRPIAARSRQTDRSPRAKNLGAEIGLIQKQSHASIRPLVFDPR